MMTPDEFLKKLLQYSDVESAIAIYKEIAGIVKKFEEVSKAARAFVEGYLISTGEFNITTAAGKASYTIPKTPKLNESRWRDAMLTNKDLLQAQANFDAAQSILNNLQEPYKELPAPTLRIS